MKLTIFLKKQQKKKNLLAKTLFLKLVNMVNYFYSTKINNYEALLIEKNQLLAFLVFLFCRHGCFPGYGQR